MFITIDEYGEVLAHSVLTPHVKKFADDGYHMLIDISDNTKPKMYDGKAFVKIERLDESEARDETSG